MKKLLTSTLILLMGSIPNKSDFFSREYENQPKPLNQVQSYLWCEANNSLVLEDWPFKYWLTVLSDFDGDGEMDFYSKPPENYRRHFEKLYSQAKGVVHSE